MKRSCANPTCPVEFEPKRPHQVYCSPRCRKAAHLQRTGDGALRGVVSGCRRLKGGKVSLTVRFEPDDAENAFQLIPGTTLEVERSGS